MSITEEILRNRVHFYVSESRLVAGLVASSAGVLMATAFGIWFVGVGWTQFDFNALNANMWAASAKGFGLKLSPEFTYALGAFAHYLQGIVFGLIFVFVVHPNFPGGLNTRDNLIKGLVWGWTLWLISSSVWMPLLFGSGFLFGTWGYANLAYNFVWHSVYGLFLGTLYNPLPKPMV